MHVYMGSCKKGTTKLMLVTGTHKQVSKYVDPKLKRSYKGVRQDEYNDVIKNLWLPEGNRLFQQSGKWSLAAAAKQCSSSHHCQEHRIHCCQCVRRAVSEVASKFT